MVKRHSKVNNRLYNDISSDILFREVNNEETCFK